MKHHLDNSLRSLYRLDDSFENAEVNGWDSYPPSQDTAYDPSFYIGRELAKTGNFSLEREFRPNKTGELELGFIRKIGAICADSTTIRCAYFIKSPSPADVVTFSICAGDGKQYLHRQLSPPLNRWNSAELKLGDFMCEGAPLGPGTVIDALYLVVRFPSAEADYTYKFFLDDFHLDGLRPSRFLVADPAISYHEMWNKSFIRRHYDRGDAIPLTLRIEEAVNPMPVSNVRATISDSHGREVARSVPLKEVSGTWSIRSLYTIGEDDPAGVWRIDLAAFGTASDAPIAKESLSFIVRKGEQSKIHPRVFFTRESIDTLRARTNDGQFSALWGKIEARAKTLREQVDAGVYPDMSRFDKEYLLPTFLAYSEMLAKTGELIGTNAFVYAISGDEVAGKMAKDNLLRACRWSTFTHPWFANRGMHTYWPVGVFSGELAMGYDLLYPLMTESERSFAAKAILEKVVIPAYKEYVVADRVPFNTSNWIGIITGGALACAAAIYGEIPESPDMEPYISGLFEKLQHHVRDTFRADGSYGEGAGYQMFSTTHLSKGLLAIENLFGIDYVASSPLKESLWQVLYAHRMENNYVVTFGDSNESGPSAWSGAIPYLVARSGNPYFQWYWQKILGHQLEGNPNSQLARFAFLFPPDLSKAKAPDSLPLNRFFDRAGSFVFRSGWGNNAAILVYQCGPFYNHRHIDQGTFILAARGEVLISEGGFTDYYADPYYQSYFIQPAAHNTLLVNRDSESQRIADFLSEISALNLRCGIDSVLATDDYTYLSSALHPVYRGKLSGYTREIFSLQPDTFILRDRMTSAGDPLEYNLLFHGRHKRDIRLCDGYTIIGGDRANILMKTVASSDVVRRIVDAPTPLREFTVNTAEMQVLRRMAGQDDKGTNDVRGVAEPCGYLEIANAAKSKEFEVVTVLRIVDGEVRDDVRLDDEGWDWLVAIPREGRITAMKIRKCSASNGKALALNGYETDGSAIVDSSVLAAHDATILSKGGIELFRSSAPVSVAMKEGDSGELAVTISTREKNQASVYRLQKPASVSGEGTLRWVWNDRERCVTLELDPGVTAFRIR